MSSDNGGWLKYVLIWDWHDLAFRGYPGWGRPSGSDSPFAVHLTVVSGRDKSSREIAVEWDDVAEGRFYYRDWTESGIPFVGEGEQYRSAFWFQFERDRERFLELYPQAAKAN